MICHMLLIATLISCFSFFSGGRRDRERELFSYGAMTLQDPETHCYINH